MLRKFYYFKNYLSFPMESMLIDSKWIFGCVKCFVVSMYAIGVLASPTVS